MVQESVCDNPQLHWMADNYIVGRARVAKEFFSLLKAENLVPDVSEVALIYMLYMLAPEVLRVWKLDPMRPEIIQAHVDAMLAIFIPWLCSLNLPAMFMAGMGCPLRAVHPDFTALDVQVLAGEVDVQADLLRQRLVLHARCSGRVHIEAIARVVCDSSVVLPATA